MKVTGIEVFGIPERYEPRFERIVIDLADETARINGVETKPKDIWVSISSSYERVGFVVPGIRAVVHADFEENEKDVCDKVKNRVGLVLIGFREEVVYSCKVRVHIQRN